MRDGTAEECMDLGCDLWMAAQDIFKECAPDDFAYQGRGVFGSTNRIAFGRHGWVALAPYCTERFVERFEAMQAKGRRKP